MKSECVDNDLLPSPPHNCSREKITPWRKKLSQGEGTGGGRIIPGRGINLLFRDIHSNAVVGFKKRLLSRPAVPRNGCATLFSTPISLLSLSLSFFQSYLLSRCSRRTSSTLKRRDQNSNESECIATKERRGWEEGEKIESRDDVCGGWKRRATKLEGRTVPDQPRDIHSSVAGYISG